MLNKSEIEILNFLLSFQFANKGLMRLVGKNYDHTGRVIKKLLDKKLIKETEISYPAKQKVLTITNEGLKELSDCCKVDKNVLQILKNKIKGNENKYRQYKFATTAEIFYPFFPSIGKDYLDSISARYYNKSLSIERAFERKSQGKSNYFISLKELREIDKYKLRKLTSTRAQGIANIQDTLYTIYNYGNKRMRAHGDFEEKFQDYVLLLTGKEVSRSLNFGSSYQIIIDTFNRTALKQYNTYILTKHLYERQYFIPLTSSGSKQLQIFFIPNFRQKIRNALISPSEIVKTETFYDGVDKTGNLVYIGFECDISEIEKLRHLLETIKIDSEIIVYAFPHQVHFFEEIFNGRAKIRTLTIDQVVSALR